MPEHPPTHGAPDLDTLSALMLDFRRALNPPAPRVSKRPEVPPERRNSVVIWRGPSRYDGAQIRAVLTFESRNEKTGNMVQLSVLSDTVPPFGAQKTGVDRSTCGECPLRPANGGGCYVVSYRLTTLWDQTRNVPIVPLASVRARLKGRKLRLGAYGDVAALPPHLVRVIVDAVGARNVTGYTHGHRALGMAGIAHLRDVCMLSVETERDALIAQKHGWRTFRAKPKGAVNLPSEITCPAALGKAHCVACGLCRGAALSAKSVAIEVHGYTWKSAERVARG